MTKLLPIQPAGWVVLGVGLTSLVGALLLNWRELLVLAFGCGAILLVSLAFVIGRSEVRLTRQIGFDRVTVGDDAEVELHAHNSGSVPTARQMITESINDEPVIVPLRALTPDAKTVVRWHPPTDKRGLYRLGPARITKADPCRLMQRDVGQTDVDELWVQPRVVPVPVFVGGLTKDIDGPTYDHSPAGDVAFHAIRPYRVGDDVRHVHWMATARAGEMMIRHYVDNRQPYISVVLDTNEASWDSPASFDAAVDIVASIGVTSLGASQPVSVHAGSRLLVGSSRRSTPRLLLDDLTLVETDAEFDIAESVGPLIAIERHTTTTVLVTGSGHSPAGLLAPTATLAQSCAVLLVQVGPKTDADSNLVAGRGVRVVEVENVDEFAARMRQRATVA